MSHDLHLGYIYHPDTPKQIRATQQFLDDRFSRQYYQHRKDHNLDGYPFFNSHLVEHVYRSYFAVKNFTAWHLGISDPTNEASAISIFWVTRLLNSLLSALAVVLVYLMGRRHFGEPAGLFAALLLATSPVDITTSNYAMSDSTAAFFALLAVFFALRVAESPRIPYYILGALAAAFAFSAKYHGGMALLPLALAHLFAFPSPKSWLGVRFWTRSLLLPLIFTAGVFLSTPALMIYPSGAYKDILGFMEYTSSFGMSSEMLALPLWARFTAAMHLNLPLLADYVGWVPFIASVFGVFWFWRNTYYLVAISLPLFFVLVGLTLKPISHPDYFTLVTSLVLLSAAAVFASLWNSRLARTPSRIIVSGLFLLSLAHLSNFAWHEIFFFRHNDTRRVAETWALDTIPREFRLFSGPYTFHSGPWNESAEHPVGGVQVLSDRTFSGDPKDASVMHGVSFEQKGKLSRNRNWNIHFLLEPNDVLADSFSLPVMPRMTPSRADDVIPAHAPHLLRSPKVLELKHQERFKASIASHKPLDTCAVILRNSAYPAEVTVRLGGKQQVLTLAPFEQAALFWDQPRPVFLPRNSHYFYSLKTQSRFNLEPVTFILANSRLEIARELHLAGLHDLAFDSFSLVSPKEMNASEKLAMAISGLASGKALEPEIAGILGEELTYRLTAFFVDETTSPDPGEQFFDEEWLFREFGVHPLVFEWLAPDTDLPLPGEVVTRQFLTLGALLASKPDTAGLRSEDWELLLYRGDAHARAGRHVQALNFYRAAQDLREGKRAVHQALTKSLPHVSEEEGEALRDLLQHASFDQDEVATPLDIRFANSIGITGFQANALRLRTGEQLEVVLHWDVPELRNDLHTLHYRVKLTQSGSGQTVFDRNYHFVRSALADRDPRDLPNKPHVEIPVSESIAPGTYVLSLAMALPAQERTLRLRSPSDSRNHKYAVITEIEVLHDKP